MSDDLLPPEEFVCGDQHPISRPPSTSAVVTLEGWRCSVCRRLSRRLVCTTCINECFAFRLKKARRADFVALRNSLAEQCQRALDACQSTTEPDLLRRLDNARPRLTMLRQAKLAVTKQLEQKRRRLSDLVDEVSYRTRVVSHLQVVCRKFQSQQMDKQRETDQRLHEQSQRSAQLTTSRCSLVKEMFENVFPVEVVSAELKGQLYPESGANNNNNQPTAAICEALSEAAAVHYCFDQWILMDEISKVQFRIVDHCMAPDHSDYSLLKQFLFNVKTDAPSASNALFTISKCAFGSCPSLAYASQLCLLLSRVLDVHLPFASRPVDFCLENICKDEFETAVLKLNANVAVLCNSAAVDLVSLWRPFMALVKLRAQADRLQVARPFRLAGDVLSEFDKALQQTSWFERETPPDLGHSDADDWESVSEALPEWTDNSSPLVHILNSATSSVTSFFKAMHI